MITRDHGITASDERPACATCGYELPEGATETCSKACARRLEKRRQKERLRGTVVVAHPYAQKGEDGGPLPTRRDRRRFDSTAGQRARERMGRREEAEARQELRQEGEVV